VRNKNILWKRRERAVMPFGRWYKLTVNCKMVCKK